MLNTTLGWEGMCGRLSPGRRVCASAAMAWGADLRASKLTSCYGQRSLWLTCMSPAVQGARMAWPQVSNKCRPAPALEAVASTKGTAPSGNLGVMGCVPDGVSFLFLYSYSLRLASRCPPPATPYITRQCRKAKAPAATQYQGPFLKE